MQKTIRDELRQTVYEGLRAFICDQLSIPVNELISSMANLSETYPRYGIADKVDFRELAPLFERLFAFNNKHYYIYKAIDDPNKIGSLSCKQYKKLQELKAVWSKRGIAGSSLHRYIEEFMSENGTMASPYKLLKRAFKENPEQTRFLGRFFPLAKDGKTTVNEDKMIQLCDLMMRSNTQVEIRDATIQECYNIDFHGSNINGSGTRHATNSCMHGKKVGAFYDGFGAHGKMVYYRGQPVGRFLIWDLPNGKKYIDRLYIRGEYINEALAKIDADFPSEQYYKYPYLRDNREVPMPIKLVNPEKFKSSPETPYIDTFAYLYRKPDTNDYYLSNSSYLDRDIEGTIYIYMEQLRRVGNSHRMHTCEHCNSTWWSGDVTFGSKFNSSSHKLYCSGYVPRTKELRAYLEIFRKGMDSLSKQGDSNAETRKFIFEI